MIYEYKTRLPLPQGVLLARHIDGMREIVAYDILEDHNLVRYDWIDGQGAQRTVFADPIASGLGDFREALDARRASVISQRGTA